MTQILAWHGDAALKADAVERMKKHRDADEFMQGPYAERGDGGKFIGCFHGCLTAEKLAEEQGVEPHKVLSTLGITAEELDGWTSWHVHGERLWGIPRDLGEQLDSIFEDHFTDVAEAGSWAVAVTEAVPVGADLSGVLDEWWEEEADDEPGLMLRLLAAAPIPEAATDA